VAQETKIVFFLFGYHRNYTSG